MSETDTQVVAMPVDVYYELEAQANHHTPATPAQRVAGTAQALIILSAIAAVVPVWGWGAAKAQNWLDERRYERVTRRQNGINSVQ